MSDEGPVVDRPEAEPHSEPAVPPELKTTGHRRIDEALERLAGLSGRPVTEHVAEYDAIHAVFHDELAAGRGEPVT